MDRKQLCVAERKPEPKSVSVSFRGNRDDVRRFKRLAEDHRIIFADFVREAVEAHAKKLVESGR